jgi:poly(3-hydroxybutyrate) depolymerase
MEFGIMRNKVLLILFLLIIFSFQLFSQGTGSFNKTIKFNGFDRTLSLHVPEEYTGEKPYKLMICLHPHADSSSHYRYQLIDYNRWNMFVEETIFVFPDGGDDEHSDFYIPKGDEEIIMRAVNYAKQFYNIDT